MERSGDAIPPQNKVQLLELLLDRGAKINQQGGEWGSALQAACQDPDVRVLRLLLKRGADANASGGMNGSALMIACGVHRDYKVNSRKCIQLLLDRGADVNAQSEEHGTALMAACGVYFEDVERVQLLLKHGANVNAQGGKYGTALMAACAVYSKDVKRLQLLLNHTAVVNAEIRRYEKLLMALEATGRENEDNRETSVEVLPPDSDYFLSPDSVPVARLLLRHKADVNAQGANYGTALSAACSWGHSELIQLLLEHGADIHLQDCTAWHKAAHYAALYLNGDKALLSLLSHGMHVNHVHKEYGTALHSIMGEFAPGGIEKSTQFWPSLHQRIAIHEHRFLTEDEHWRRSFDVLIKHGMDTSIVSERLGSALHVACAMKLDETHRKANHSGSCCPSIHCTSRKTKYLLERVPGMDVNVQGGIFGSALQAAAYSGQALSVKMLLERKASVDVRGGKYRSALNGAIVGGHWDIVEILLEAGATPDCDLQEQPDEEWLQTLLKEDGRGAVERYQKFWDMRKEKKSKGI
jgi:ankyrin repeat protein